MAKYMVLFDESQCRTVIGSHFTCTCNQQQCSHETELTTISSILICVSCFRNQLFLTCFRIFGYLNAGVQQARRSPFYAPCSFRYVNSLFAEFLNNSQVKRLLLCPSLHWICMFQSMFDLTKETIFQPF